MKNNFKNVKKGGMLSVLGVSCIIGFMGLQTLYAAGPSPVNLLSASNFVVLAKSGISTTGSTLIVGDIGVSPLSATSMTGFALSLTAESPFATSPLVSGKVYAPGYANPTPGVLTVAVGDMETAYTNAAGRTNPTATELGAGNIGGLTIAPGLYKWGTGVTISADVTLAGGANDTWIFQIAQNFDISSATKVLLSGGAQANNVFWIVAGQTTLGTNSVFNGNILDQTAIVINTGAVLNGRALAQTAVTLDSNIVTIPVKVTTQSNVSDGIHTQVTINPTTPIVLVATLAPVLSVVNTTGSSVNTTVDLGCSLGNKFNTVTGYMCGSHIATVTPTVTTYNTTQNMHDSGCLPGNKFSITTGNICSSLIGGISNLGTSTTASFFGQQVKTIATNLHEGSNGSDVKILQEFLISQNKGRAAISLATVGATSHFGVLTRAALAEFQTRAGIAPAFGNFGLLTRAYIHSH